MISYHTGAFLNFENQNLVFPIDDLQKSETHGLEKLELINSTYTNVPKLNRTYINRAELEKKIFDALISEKKWPIVTLRGRGGIGKTSTALEVLHKITEEEYFDAIIWFSARDIDFEDFGGPVIVKPRVISKSDISSEYLELIEHPDRNNKSFNKNDEFVKELESNTFGRALFVFDNFETIEKPGEIFDWIEDGIVLPNKILITTRHREFDSDKQIEVDGMLEEEFIQLVDSISNDLEITELTNQNFKKNLFKMSQGHPYVVKILLGELSNNRNPNALKRVFEDKDQILQALFERTYDNLSPLSQKIFQVLCSIRGIIPEIIFEAVIICNQSTTNESELYDIDVNLSIEELRKFSFIELINPKEEYRFINVPLAASIFGLTRLKANPNKAQIQLYTKILHEFGSIDQINISKDAVHRCIVYFFSTLRSTEININDFKSKYWNTIKFLARRHKETWIEGARFFQFKYKDFSTVKQCYQNYLNSVTNDSSKTVYWNLLGHLYKATGEIQYYYQTKIDRCEYKGCPLDDIVLSSYEITKDISDKNFSLNSDIKKEMLQRLIKMIEKHPDYSKATATQMARLAWLYIHIGQTKHGLLIANKGLKIDNNDYACNSIIGKINNLRNFN